MASYKVLVANRGESECLDPILHEPQCSNSRSKVAIRVLRGATELGWSTVAVYTGNDTSHATYADEAVELDNASRYMDAQHLVDVAQRCVNSYPLCW